MSSNGIHKVKRPGIVLPGGSEGDSLLAKKLKDKGVAGAFNQPPEPGLFPEFLFVARDPDKGESGIKISLKPGGFVAISKYDDKGKADALYQWNGSDWTDAHGLLALDADKAN